MLPLTQVLVEFARIMGTDFSVQEILDHLVARIVDILPVTGAGVMLMGADQELHFLAATNDTLLAIESLQNELIEGPCLDAYESGHPVSIPDLRLDESFPRFSPRALESGLAAVFTFPLSLDNHRLGALDLYRDKSGALSDRDLQIAQVLADVAAGYLINAQSRREAAASAAELRRQSLHDPLTGLANRTLLVELMDKAVARASRSHHFAAVLFIDLDGFKGVNDHYGHHVGDQLLCAVAERLVEMVRPGDTVSRIGGDEFVALCEDITQSGDAELIAQRITRALATPFRLGPITVNITGSVGVAFSGPGQDIPAILLRNADFAMYQAKNRGGSQHHISDPAARLAADSRSDLERDLREAERLNQFQLAYQPIVEVGTGRLVGVEALLRWDHPGRGRIMPNVIIPSAERTGLIVSIGDWVLQQACRDLAQWTRDASGIDSVSVNVSANQMMGTSFAKTVAHALQETGVDPSAVCLEVTESLFLGDSARARSVMKELKDLGVRLSLDDFGTGYSSLSYLRHFPVDSVKIDRSFIGNLNQDGPTKAIVRSVIGLSHELDLTVVAEGVETLVELREVSALRADFVQGYRFGRPLPKAKLTELVAIGAASWASDAIRAARVGV